MVVVFVSLNLYFILFVKESEYSITRKLNIKGYKWNQQQRRMDIEKKRFIHCHWFKINTLAYLVKKKTASVSTVTLLPAKEGAKN